MSYTRIRSDARGRWTFLLALALGAAGCGWLEDGDPPARARIRLPPESHGATALWVGTGARLWVATPRGLLGVDTASGRVVARVSTAGEGIPRVFGSADGRSYAATPGGRLLLLDAVTGAVRANREGAPGNRYALDPAGREVYAATRSGAILGLDPLSLQTRWSWPRLALRTTALAVSPEGDRVYHAVSDPAHGNEDRVLIRDAQTGRVLATQPLPAPLRSLVSGWDGTLFGVSGEEGDESVVALRPGPDGLELRWRQTARSLELTGPVALRVAPEGARVAVFAPGSGGGVRVLDADTGEPVAAVEEGPFDADFGADGVLFLLYPGEIRIL